MTPVYQPMAPSMSVTESNRVRPCLGLEIRHVIAMPFRLGRSLPVHIELSMFDALKWYRHRPHRAQGWPFGAPPSPLTSFTPSFSLRLLTALASDSSTVSVSSQPIHASVMDTPYFRPALPSAGTFWFPVWHEKISHNVLR
jgi:hypothetical protein